MQTNRLPLFALSMPHHHKFHHSETILNGFTPNTIKAFSKKDKPALQKISETSRFVFMLSQNDLEPLKPLLLHCQTIKGTNCRTHLHSFKNIEFTGVVMCFSRNDASCMRIPDDHISVGANGNTTLKEYYGSQQSRILSSAYQTHVQHAKKICLC